MSPRRSLLLLSILASLTACKEADDGHAVGGDAGSDASARGRQNTGFVQVTQQRQGAGGKLSALATAWFVADLDPALCPQQMLGPCRFFSCPGEGPDGGIQPTPHRAHAGRITFQPSGPAIVLDPAATAEYPVKIQDAPLWQPGDTVTVMAAGAEVPAFSGSLRAPGDVVVTQPAPPMSTATLTVPRGADLEVAWTGGTEGEVTFILSPDRPARTALTCTFPADAGHATISKTALALLPAGTGLVAAGVATTQDLSRGGWKVTFNLVGSAQWSMPIFGFTLPAKFE